jgi:hypothetical protein
LGTTVTGATGVTSLYPGTGVLRIGTDFAGTATLLTAGKLYRTQILNGINGTPVLDVDCTQITTGAATTFPARTLQTVTINRAASGKKSVAVTQPCWLFGTDSYIQVADNDLLDMGATDSFSVVSVIRAWNNPGAAYKAILTKITANGTLGWRQIMEQNTFATMTLINDGTASSGAVSSPISAGSISVLGGTFNRSSQTAVVYMNATPSAAASTSAIGSVANTRVLRVGQYSDQTTTGYDMEFIAGAVFRRALTQDEISLLNVYYQGLDLGVYQPPKYPTYARLPAPTTDGNLAYAQDSKDLLIAREGRWDGILTESSALLPVPADAPPGERLARQAVWWIDAQAPGSSDSGAVNLGWGGTGLNAAQATAANQPKFLSYNGVPYVYLPGVASNYMNVPNEAALSPLGDIDIRARVALDDWTPAAVQTLVGKWGASGNRSWRLSVMTTGYLAFFGSLDGITEGISTTSGVATGFADGSVKWVRVTRQKSSGEVKFYTSDDGLSWAQLGTTYTGSTADMTAGTSVIEFGSRGIGGSDPSAGKFYRCVIKSTIDGPSVLDIDTSLVASGSATSFPALTGQTVSIARATTGRKSVAVVAPVWLFGTDDYLEVADNDLLDFGATGEFTIIAVVRRWASSATNWYITKWNSNLASGTPPGYALYSGSSLVPTFRIADGTTGQGVNGTLLPAGSLAMLTGVRSVSTDKLNIYGVAPSASSTDTTTGSLTDTSPLRVGAQAWSTTGALDGEGVAFLLFRRVLTDAEITTLSDYFKGRAA